MKAVADADNESTDDTARIDAVVLIKTGILNRDDRVLHIERNLLNRNRDTVSLSPGQLLYLVAVSIVDKRRVAERHDICLRDIRGTVNHAADSAAHKPGVSEKAAELAEKISKYARVKLDDSDNAPGWKFSQWEMKGVPLRLEIGPKDLEKNQCVLVRRDTREKVFVSLDELETAIPAQLEALRKDLYQRALENREKRTWAATTMDEVKELAKANTGYIKTMWCGDLACEMKMKEEAGLSSRCMPFEQEHLSDVCPCCGKPAKAMVYWGVAY